MLDSNEKRTKNSNELDIYLFHQGTNYSSYQFLGAHFGIVGKKKGVWFRVWAPHADKICVIGDFNNWGEWQNEMNKISEQGVWEVFIENVNNFDSYKYLILNGDKKIYKSDPYAFHSETPPKTASKVYDLSKYKWNDEEYLANKTEVYNKPVNIYEVNLLSWKKHQNGDYYSYRDYAKYLVKYILEMGYTHVEFMPLSEFPFDGSWGYQVTGYYSITSRFGTPDDFRFLVDTLHNNGIGVILDWVPAHFPKDEHGLFEFDGDYCYENQGWDRQEHKTWGTRIFDWGRNEVQSFLISNAIFLLKEFHLDGLRVDAVASMLYLDYDRKDGEWIPNENGGNYNLQAIEFFKKLNTVVFEKYPKSMMIAEESTSFPMITKPTYMGGLGFNYKWNMGWMNDVLDYMQTDPYFRANKHSKLTFSMCYAFSENFVLPISHDEVVHGKKSLLDKMPGNIEDKFSNLRAFNVYMMAHPGKKLSFMGNEYGQFKEWNYKEGLEFFMTDFELHRKLKRFNKELNIIYLNTNSLFEIEDSWDGFNWISPDEANNNVISFERKDKKGNTIVVIVNFSGNDYSKYRLGLGKGEYKLILCTDDKKYGGRGLINKRTYKTAKKSAHSRTDSILIRLPRLSALLFEKI